MMVPFSVTAPVEATVKSAADEAMARREFEEFKEIKVFKRFFFSCRLPSPEEKMNTAETSYCSGPVRRCEV